MLARLKPRVVSKPPAGSFQTGERRLRPYQTVGMRALTMVGKPRPHEDSLPARRGGLESYFATSLRSRAAWACTASRSHVALACSTTVRTATANLTPHTEAERGKAETKKKQREIAAGAITELENARICHLACSVAWALPAANPEAV